MQRRGYDVYADKLEAKKRWLSWSRSKGKTSMFRPFYLRVDKKTGTGF